MSMIRVTREDIKRQLNGDLTTGYKLMFDLQQDVALRTEHRDDYTAFIFNYKRIHSQVLLDALINRCQNELSRGG